MANTTYVFSAYPDGSTVTSTCSFKATPTNKKGNIIKNSTKGVKLGSTDVKAIYKGDIQIWPEVKTLYFVNIQIYTQTEYKGTSGDPHSEIGDPLLNGWEFDGNSSEPGWEDMNNYSGSDFIQGKRRNHGMWELVNTFGTFKYRQYKRNYFVCDIQDITYNSFNVGSSKINIPFNSINIKWEADDGTVTSINTSTTRFSFESWCYMQGTKFYYSPGWAANISSRINGGIKRAGGFELPEKPQNATITRTSPNTTFNKTSGTSADAVETNQTVNGVSGRTILKRYAKSFGFEYKDPYYASSPYTSYALYNNGTYIPYRYIFKGCSWNPSCVSYFIKRSNLINNGNDITIDVGRSKCNQRYINTLSQAYMCLMLQDGNYYTDVPQPITTAIGAVALTKPGMYTTETIRSINYNFTLNNWYLYMNNNFIKLKPLTNVPLLARTGNTSGKIRSKTTLTYNITNNVFSLTKTNNSGGTVGNPTSSPFPEVLITNSVTMYDYLNLSEGDLYELFQTNLNLSNYTGDEKFKINYSIDLSLQSKPKSFSNTNWFPHDSTASFEYEDGGIAIFVELRSSSSVLQRHIYWLTGSGSNAADYPSWINSQFGPKTQEINIGQNYGASNYTIYFYGQRTLSNFFYLNPNYTIDNGGLNIIVKCLWNSTDGDNDLFRYAVDWEWPTPDENYYENRFNFQIYYEINTIVYNNTTCTIGLNHQLGTNNGNTVSLSTETISSSYTATDEGANHHNRIFEFKPTVTTTVESSSTYTVTVTQSNNYCYYDIVNTPIDITLAYWNIYLNDLVNPFETRDTLHNGKFYKHTYVMNEYINSYVTYINRKYTMI